MDTKYNRMRARSRSESVMTVGQGGDSSLTGISVLYHNELKASRIKLNRHARAAARRELLQPFGMSRSRKPLRPSDPTQNNPNSIGAKIIPQGQGPM